MNYCPWEEDKSLAPELQASRQSHLLSKRNLHHRKGWVLVLVMVGSLRPEEGVSYNLSPNTAGTGCRSTGVLEGGPLPGGRTDH